ncbi:MAG: hypothetical protein PSX71_08500 [bacterium]|nr:hypothetical protein [bacterium]
MSSRYQSTQEKISAALLRSPALALLIVASAAHAEPVTLSCRPDTGSDTITLRIDYSSGLVEQLAPSGNAYTNRIAPNASISTNAIVWSAKLMDTGLQTPVPMQWEGTIDRLSGTGWTSWSRSPDWTPYRETFTCREATKPRF